MTAKKKKAEVTPAAIVAFKGFDKDLKCRDFQYEVGKTYTHSGAVKHCSSGFHACESPLDVWGYYGPFDSRFAIVEVSGEVSREEGGDSKIAAANITIKAELKLPEFIKTAVQWIIDSCKTDGGQDEAVDSAQIGSSGDYAQIGSSGDYARIGSSGDYARIGSSGDYARIGSSGDYAQIGSSGDSARIGSSGYSAQIGSSGDSARIGSSGDYAQIGSSGYYAQIGSSGDSAQIVATGKDAVVACAGSVEQFKVGVGGCIAVPYRVGGKGRVRFALGYEGENIKADVTYEVNAKGEFVEVAQ